MKRTNHVAALFLMCLGASGAAQEPAPPPASAAQPDPVDELVAAMRAREQQLRSVALVMRTTGRLTEDLRVTTRGVLHVVLGAQRAIHTRFEFEMSDGVKGRAESAQTAEGILLLEDDPAFGEVFVHIDARTVADLEWAGAVLQRDDLPGMPPRDGGKRSSDRRADAPLGSAILAALRRQFDLAVDKRTERDGEPGTWIVGPRRAGFDAQDPDLPAADRVELFVRTKDLALLEAKYLEGSSVVQHLVVEAIELDGEIAPEVFRITAGGQRPRSLDSHAPLRELIEKACVDAELETQRQADARIEQGDKSAKAEKRPSRR